VRYVVRVGSRAGRGRLAGYPARSVRGPWRQRFQSPAPPPEIYRAERSGPLASLQLLPSRAVDFPARAPRGLCRFGRTSFARPCSVRSFPRRLHVHHVKAQQRRGLTSRTSHNGDKQVSGPILVAAPLLAGSRAPATACGTAALPTQSRLASMCYGCASTLDRRRAHRPRCRQRDCRSVQAARRKCDRAVDVVRVIGSVALQSSVDDRAEVTAFRLALAAERDRG